MRLLRLREVEIGPNDRVYRHSRVTALVGWLAGASLAGVFVYYGYTEKQRFLYFFAGIASLFLLLMLRMVTARFHPSNWLVRLNETGIYVQYRSYLNYELPPDDPSVFFLSLGEIGSARLIKERVTTPDPSRQGASQTQFLRYIELELSGDTAALADALNAEHGEAAPMKKRWYGGSSATLYRDYPVNMSGPTSVRIHWGVAPGTHSFLNALRPYTEILDPVSLTPDFTHMKFVSREEQQKQLRDLVRRGQDITAIYAAQKLYGGSLAEAKRMVESLNEDKVLQ